MKKLRGTCALAGTETLILANKKKVILRYKQRFFYKSHL